MDGAWPPWDDPALRVASDPPRRARYRALQSWYRETELRAPPGRHRSGRLVGSLLPAELELARLNFLDDQIAGYAERRAAEVVRAGGTLDPTRLRRNLLSSMPLCLSLRRVRHLHHHDRRHRVPGRGDQVHRAVHPDRLPGLPL